MSNQYSNSNRAYIARRAMFWKIRNEYLDDVAEREAILESSPPPPDGQPGGRRVTDPTGDKALRLAVLSRFVNGVDGAIRQIPEEYRQGVWNHVLYGKRFPALATRSTWERWERYFLGAAIVRTRE